MTRFLLVLVLLSLLNIASAQQSGQYSFAHYTISGGLVSNQTNSVIQDEDGYIWIATNDGLQRYDGTRYKTFRHSNADPNSLPINQVWQLIKDAKGNLWLLLADGSVGSFSRKDFSFHPVGIRPRNMASLNQESKHLYADEYGNVFFFLIGAEVLVWNPQKNEFSFDQTIFKLEPGWPIWRLCQQPGTHKYWMSILNKGLAVYDQSTGTLSYAGHNVAHEKILDRLADKTVILEMHVDTKNRLWAVNWENVLPYVYCYNLVTDSLDVNHYQFNDYLRNYHEINGLFEQPDGTVWLKGTRLLAKFLDKENTFEPVYNGYQNDRSIDFEHIGGMCEDRDGNLWLASINNGVYRFNPRDKRFLNVQHINRKLNRPGEGSPMSFISTNYGAFIAGVWGEGIYSYDKNFNPIATGIKGIDENGGPFAWSVYPSKDSNTIWMSSQPGMYAFDQAKRSVTFHDPPALESKTVRQVVEDRYGNLWLGMQRTGVFKWVAAKGQKNFNDGIERFSHVPGDQVTKMIVDHKGYVWVVTSISGVYMIDPGTDKVLLHFSSDTTGAYQLPEKKGAIILDYNDSIMVICTNTRLVCYNRNTHKTFIPAITEGLSGFIASAEKDKRGNIWLATSNGLYRINLQKNLLKRYGQRDGIGNENFITAASATLPDGRLVFGSNKQFVVIHPDSMNISTTLPDVKITGFVVMNKSLPVDSIMQLQQVDLSYLENTVVVEFSSLNYDENFKIQYKLESLDKEWKTADASNQAVYSYLPAGSYSFLLRAFDEQGDEATQRVTLHITVHAPFWRTAWFYVLLTLLVAGILFWIYRESKKRKEAIQKMRSDIAGNLHQEVNTALNNINFLSELAKLKADKDINKSKEYIEQIHSKSRHMITAMDDMLWSIDPSNDNMQKTVYKMREFVEALNHQYGADIEILVDDKVKTLKLDMQFRHEAFILFKTTLEGLLKAGASDCKIHIGVDKNLLVYTIQFNNDVFDVQQLNNLLQRKDFVKRMESIEAESGVELHKTNSSLILKLPVR
ncbi:MAG: two-component regulator propeller domain-containing protein [Bacteroidota bacterium]